jgi:AcrR family transcriptional regulator
MGELREKKKREARQRISDRATALFLSRGFDEVTLDEVAVAAKVSKMTVFNYFARKEDLMLDREEDLRLLSFREALRQRPRGQAPSVALRRVVEALREQPHPMGRIDRKAVRWWRVVAASPSLTARLREFGEEAAHGLAVELAGPRPDGRARLMAGLIVLTVRVAREEGLRVFERGGSARRAHATFLSLLEQGLAAVDGLSRGSGRLHRETQAERRRPGR